MRRLLLAALLLTAALSHGQVDPKLPRQLFDAASKAYNEKRYGESAALYLYGIRHGRGDSTVYYNAACSLALAGDKEEAFRCLRAAVKAGWRDVEHLRSDTDLASLHADPRWTRLVRDAESALARYQKEKANPANAGWVTSDVSLFWRAYDLAMKAPAEKRADVFETEYLAKGTIGLQDFMTVRRANSQRLADWVNKHPKFFEAVRPRTLEIAKLKPTMQTIYARMKDLYPQAMFPDVYFLVGGFFGGGTVSSNGLLISAEMQGQFEGLPVDELNDWERTVVAPVEELPALVAHELIHFQQRYPSGGRNLLRACIQEGSASFIGTLISGYMSKRETEQHAYGNAHEKELWEKFSKELDQTDTTKWLYSGSGEGVRPDDLGYWMG